MRVRIFGNYIIFLLNICTIVDFISIIFISVIFSMILLFTFASKYDPLAIVQDIVFLV